MHERAMGTPTDVVGAWPRKPACMDRLSLNGRMGISIDRMDRLIDLHGTRLRSVWYVDGLT